jgi:predicted ArsR family transcriptional regulator
MQKTREHILAYLRQNHGASSLDMSRVFGHTPANVRHHLKILEARDLVVIVGERPSTGRGRPERIYALASEKGNPALTQLIKQLLNRTGNKSSFEMRKLAKRFFRLKEPYSGSSSHRLAETMQIFEPFGYQPVWEATSSGPNIHLQRCPFAEIINEHPELCQLDAAGMKQILGEDVEQTEKLEADQEGLLRCTFILPK